MKTLASLTVAALVLAAAGSASAQEARVEWGDLNLSTAAGAAAFDQRIEVAARKMCRDARSMGSNINDRSSCMAAVKADVLRQLPSAAQVDYAKSRSSLVV